MAVWKVPRITTAQRVALTPQASELIYDTEQQAFFGGDGMTPGGISIGSSSIITLEAGEQLAAGAPVKVINNKLYAADQAADATVIGVVMATTAATYLARAAYSGAIKLDNLQAGSVYYCGFKNILTTAPTSGYVIRVGTAISSDTLLVNIEEPIMLS